MSISPCPRCSYYSFERLQTYAHCFNCNYFFDPCNNWKEERRLQEAIRLLKKYSATRKRILPHASRLKHVFYPPEPGNTLCFKEGTIR